MKARSSTSNFNASLPRRRWTLAQRRARHTLFWCAAMLALSPILGGYLVDHCPLRFRHPEAASALSRWRESEPRPNVLLLGSSRMGSFTQAPSLEETVRNLTGDQSVCIFNASITSG